MRWLKELIYRLLVLSGLAHLVAWLNRRKAVVLAYHDVYAGRIDPVHNFDGLRVRIDRFERQMRYLASRYHVVPLDYLLDAPAGPDGGAVAAITFDDGYETTYQEAVPVLRRIGLPATVFVITEFLVHGRALWWDRLRAMVAATRQTGVVVEIQGRMRRLRLLTIDDRKDALRLLAREVQGLPPDRREILLGRLSADLEVKGGELVTGGPLNTAELREMADRGIAVGSHGCSQDSFLHLSREHLLAELTESKRVLESVTGFPVAWLAYPYGEFSREVTQLVREAGYRGALTTMEGLNDGISDPFAIRRVGVDDNMSFPHFIVVVSGLRDLLKGMMRAGGGGPMRTETAGDPAG
ncbi:MAG: polysaccharide deacetylase family protein [Gemmatimonadetes bacterium]|nr:polysaccharide deacetylase family protein [Gemmatimonadota bacterium]